MKRIHYEQSWCDYFTKCPYEVKDEIQRTIEVGSYDCYNCPHFASFYSEKLNPTDSLTSVHYVNCKFEDNENN